MIGVLGVVAAVVLLSMFYAGTSPGATGLSWRSYYLFWLLAPTVLALIARHPLVLLLVPVGLVARRWLPDPYLWLRRAGRISSLEAQSRANEHDVVARRQLAMLYLEQRRPLRALPLVQAALEREPGSTELLHLRGLSQLGARRWADAVDSFIAVLQRDASFRYGEPYLRLADALEQLARWKDTEEALEHFLATNGSTLEGWVRLARIRRMRSDHAAADAALRSARELYASLPRFQRRGQLGWYLRTFVPSFL